MTENITIYPDEEGDFFEINIRKTTKWPFIEIRDGITERIDEKTGKNQWNNSLKF